MRQKQTRTSNTQNSNTSKAYLIDNYKAPESAKQWLDYMLKMYYCLDDKQYVATLHVLVSPMLSSFRKYNDGWAYVPYTLFEKHFGGNPLIELIKKGEVIEQKKYIIGYKCAGYRVVNSLRSGFIKAEADGVINNELIVDLFTGQQIKQEKVRLYDESNNAIYSKRVMKTLQILNSSRTPHNIKAMLEHHHTEINKLEELSNLYQNHPDNLLVFTAYRRQEARVAVDNTALITIKSSTITVNTIVEGFPDYEPKYDSTITGRRQEKGVGLQGCTREMKEKAFSGIPNVNNYDRKASIPSIAAYELSRIGLDSSWLEAYLNNPRAKYEYAERIGIDVDTWKRCFCALLTAGTLPKNPVKYLQEEYESDIVENILVDDDYVVSPAMICCYILQASGNDINKFNEIYAKFVEVATPLHKELNKYHKWLDEVWVPQNRKLNRRTREWEVINMAGVIRNLSQFPKHKARRYRKLAAFVLQGIEAAIMQIIIWNSKEGGYRVLSDQHDGLVVLGTIPDHLVRFAHEEVGVPYSPLEVKSFV